MKRLSTGLLAAILAVGCGLTAVSANAATTQGNNGPYASTKQVAQAGNMMPPADFGAPPSGEVPILFNDRHVYSKPDRLKAGRVLAAIVRGNTILVPLRSMFEQMGGTVSYDPSTKTVDVSKPGADIKLTVGKPEVVLNGESRPLDVPPEIYKGVIVVPIRVISEQLGAYVLWVQEKHVVVVRYVAAVAPTPAPTAPPTPTPAPVVTAPPTVPPTPTPAPKPTVAYEKFIVGDYLFAPKVYNEFSGGNTGKGGSYGVRGGFEFPLFNLPWMLEGDYRSYQYPHNNSTFPAACPNGDQGCVTVIGAYGQTNVPAFTARDTDFDGRFGLKIADPRIYVGVGYIHREDNYGYPKQNGIGFGIEKLPDLDQPFSVYGSAWYYPNLSGNFTFPSDGYTSNPVNNLAGTGGKLQYRFLKYQIGGTYALAKSSGLFLDFGFLGDSGRGKSLSPSDFTHGAAYLGLGFHF